MHTPDYTVRMQDSTGRVYALVIIGACIDDLISEGYTPTEAREAVQDNQFGNAIARGDIGADAWLTK